MLPFTPIIKLTQEVLDIIESTMQDDDEATAKEIQFMLRGLGISLSRRTILTERKHLDKGQPPLFKIHVIIKKFARCDKGTTTLFT